MTLRCRMGALSVALALVIAGCGGSEPDRFGLTTPRGAAGSTSAEPPRTPVTDAEKRVIRGWSTELRNGDVRAAAKYFSVPVQVSIAQSDELDSASQVRNFNESLPCGAQLISLQRSVDHLVLADFELTDRPGGACDSVGTRASFAFLIDGDDHIARFLMVPVGEQPPSSSSATSA